MDRTQKVDFRIVSKPAYIEFTCPDCGSDVRIPWRQVNEPESWSDDWGTEYCPDCNAEIQLGEWEYD